MVGRRTDVSEDGLDRGFVADSRAAVLSWLGRERVDSGLIALVLLILVSLALVARSARAPLHEVAGVGFAGLLVARGLVRGRRIVVAHVVGSIALLGIARLADSRGHLGTAWLATLAAGATLVLPDRPPKPANSGERRHLWALVDRTAGDSLAPFALRTDKNYALSPDGLAAVAYRVRFGTAVAAGDPVGEPESRLAAIDTFVEHARAHGWRIAVIGAGEQTAAEWRRRGLWGLAIGREVLIDVSEFTLVGRRFRNLRQAVQRSRNFGVTTEIHSERSLPPEVRDELIEVARAARRPLPPRGFTMILDHPLDAVHPGTLVAIARDDSGRAVAFQRFASADSGRELSLDLPWRAPYAPNGVDERLTVDMVEWARERGVRRVSLAFAPFPEVFEPERLGWRLRLAKWSVHRLDAFIHLESLYRYLRKFHAFGPRRHVLLRPLEIVWVLAALLTLEFSRPSSKPKQRRFARLLRR